MRAARSWHRLSEATAFALTLHADQLRKGTDIPYIAHLLSVAALVLEHGGDEDLAVAGLLHDAVEDCGAEHEAVIAERFGDRVAAVVRDCTDADTFPKPPWQARKQAYLEHLEVASGDALLVSACDKLHNARAIVSDLQTHGPVMFERFKAGQEGTLWYYRALANLFGHRLPGPLSRELIETVTTMERLATS
jgi:GTP pyrophosphokinase